MNILQVNNSDILSLRLNEGKTNKIFTPKFNLRMAAPLAKDTVSFGATAKIANKALEANRSTVRNVRAAMQDSYQKVNKMFDNDVILTTNRHADDIIGAFNDDEEIDLTDKLSKIENHRFFHDHQHQLRKKENQLKDLQYLHNCKN